MEKLDIWKQAYLVLLVVLSNCLVFDLSKNYSNTFSLSGIPANENYIVHLVIKDPAEIELIKQNYLSYQIKEGNRTIRNVSASLNNFTASEGGGFSKFYYYENHQLPETDIYVPLGNTKLLTTISISYQNIALTNSKDGYFEIRFGGFK